ncbi:MAG: hypothetical protein ACJ77A_11180 [Actinomycetota bacterium]
MKPYLLIDVDGVINVFRQDAPSDADDQVFEAEGFWIRVPRGMQERFERLEAAFECVWATTWEDAAPGVIGEHLGFGREWPAIPMGLEAILRHGSFRPCSGAISRRPAVRLHGWTMILNLTPKSG